MGEDSTRIRPPRDARPREDGRCLVFVGGERLGERIGLESEIVLGRDAACTVALASEDVSRRHARIAPDGDAHVLVDLGSTNGTHVNGQPVRVHRLAPGDRIQLGSSIARYLEAGAADAGELAALAELARRDPLTGLANRRAFDEALAQALARALRDAAPLAIAILDVDHFKRVNDLHGHPAGDAVLAAVAARAAAALRQGDLLARVGGEELAAILPGGELGRAAEVAERLRRAVASSPIDAAGAPLEVTVSVGVAALEPGERDAAALLARADARLYEAKRAGRNRVAS